MLSPQEPLHTIWYPSIVPLLGSGCDHTRRIALDVVVSTLIRSSTGSEASESSVIVMVMSEMVAE